MSEFEHDCTVNANQDLWTEQDIKWSCRMVKWTVLLSRRIISEYCFTKALM